MTKGISDVNVEIDGLTVAALMFDTRRAPYVIQYAQGEIRREVPWRDGTAIRSATRSELLLILSTVPQIPEFELLTAKIVIWPPGDKNPSFSGNINLELYLRPQTKDPEILPLHDYDLTIRLIEPTAGPIHCNVYDISPDSIRQSLSSSDIEKARRYSAATIHRRDRDLIVTGPGSLYIESDFGRGDFGNVLFPIGFEKMGMHVEFTMNDASLPRAIIVQGDLAPADANSNGQYSPTSWYFQKHPTTWNPF